MCVQWHSSTCALQFIEPANFITIQFTLSLNSVSQASLLFLRKQSRAYSLIWFHALQFGCYTLYTSCDWRPYSLLNTLQLLKVHLSLSILAPPTPITLACWPFDHWIIFLTLWLLSYQLPGYSSTSMSILQVFGYFWVLQVIVLKGLIIEGAKLPHIMWPLYLF